MGIYIKDYPTNLIWFLGVSENGIYPWNGHFMGNMMNRRIFFLGILFCEKLVQSWPYLLVSNCKKGRLAGSWRCWTGPMTCCSDSLVSSCLPFFVQGWVWLRHMAHMNSCRSKVLCQTPAAPRYFQNVVLVSCFSDSYGPFDSARVKNSDGSATVRLKCWATGEPLPWLRLRLGTCWGCTRHRRPTKKSCRIYGKMSFGWQTRGELFDHLWESEINFLATPK